MVIVGFLMYNDSGVPSTLDNFILNKWNWDYILKCNIELGRNKAESIIYAAMVINDTTPSECANTTKEYFTNAISSVKH